MEKCANCGNEFEGKYCNRCGQEVIKRLEVKSIMKDVVHSILHWENSVLKTLKNLLIRPGKTVREYISGKRKSFIKPFSYFISIQTIFVIVFHRMNEKYFAFLNVDMKGEAENTTNRAIEIQHLIGQYINYLNYFMPVVFAFYFYLFFRKKTGVNYAESLAVSLYWVGTTLVFSIVLMLLSVIDIRSWNARFVVNLLFYVFAIITFSDLTIWKGIYKGILVTLLSYISFVLIVMILILSYLYIAEGISIL